MIYIAEAWWPGNTYISLLVRDRVVSTNKAYLEDILNRPLKVLIRAVILAYKDVPLITLWREIGIILTKVWIKTDVFRASVR